MKYFINKKIISMHDTYEVKDENNTDVYEISRELLSPAYKTNITDMNGNQIASIEKELLNFLPHFKVSINNQQDFKVELKPKLMKFYLELSTGGRIEGDARGLNFTMFDENNNQIGIVTRPFISFGRKYEVSVLDQAKKEMVLALFVIVALVSGPSGEVDSK